MSSITYQESDQGNTFEIRMHPCTREPRSWKEELSEAARDIMNRTTKPIWICSSGGLSSEVICRAFFDQGINFSVLTLKHMGGTNAREVQLAVEWCRQRSIRHELVSIDIPTFLTKDVPAYAERYVAAHPLRYLQLKLLELIEERGGYAVLGWREPLFELSKGKKQNTKDDMYVRWSVGTLAPLKWCEAHATSHEPFFFSSTPELCLSYVKEPLISFALDNPDAVFAHKSNSYLLRKIFFQTNWPDLKQRFQSNGFEHTRSLLQDTIERLSRTFTAKLSSYHMPVIEYERQLRGVDAPRD